MSRKYNFIFSKIVQDETDMIGYVAYCIYKKNKIKHIEEFKAAHGNADPTEAELESFHSLTASDDSIIGYRLRAESILQNFTDEVLSNVISNIEADTLKNQTENLKAIIAPITPQKGAKAFFNDVFKAAITELVVLILFGAFLIALYVKDKGAKDVFQSVTGTTITENPPKTDSAKNVDSAKKHR